MIRPEERYLRDPVFHNLVDLLSNFLEENAMSQWTPTELREAVVLATCRYEMMHVRPLIIDVGKYRFGEHHGKDNRKDDEEG